MITSTILIFIMIDVSLSASCNQRALHITLSYLLFLGFRSKDHVAARGSQDPEAISATMPRPSVNKILTAYVLTNSTEMNFETSSPGIPEHMLRDLKSTHMSRNRYEYLRYVILQPRPYHMCPGPLPWECQHHMTYPFGFRAHAGMFLISNSKQPCTPCSTRAQCEDLLLPLRQLNRCLTGLHGL